MAVHVRSYNTEFCQRKKGKGDPTVRWQCVAIALRCVALLTPEVHVVVRRNPLKWTVTNR